MIFNDYCATCNQSIGTSQMCICKEQSAQLDKCPNCLICNGQSIYGGEYIGYPSAYDGEFICADCLANLIDKKMEKIKNVRV